jgi:hypothetical protein
MFHLSALVRSFALTGGLAIAVLLFTLSSSMAAVLSFFGSGISSKGTPLAVQADLTLSGTTLTLALANVAPTPSVFAEDVLGSFYFDIVKNGVRPTLNYAAAEGLVWQVKNNGPDLPINSAPSPVVGGLPSYTVATGTIPHVPSDLRAFKEIDQSWQFRPMDATASPFLGFGLGTVGNSLFGVNNFTPQIVGPPGPDLIRFGIYRDSLIAPDGKPMNGQYLVRDTATFVFTSPELADYAPEDIVPQVVFGFGANPDTILVVPEPAGLASLVGIAVCGVICVASHRRRRTGVAAAGRPRFPGSPGRAAVGGLVLVATGLLLAPPRATAATLDPIDIVSWNFANGPSGWVAQNQNRHGTTSAPNIWAWQRAGGFWRVEPSAVLFTWVANHLTSPLFSMPQATDALEVTMKHRYNLPVALASPQKPIAAGQVVYRIFDTPPLDPFNDPTPFLPLPASAWIDEIVEPPTAAVPPLSRTVLPTFGVPANLPPMIPAGMAFSRASPGLAQNAFVVSRFMLDGLLEPGDFVQLRFINGNLGGICTGARWDVASVDVQGLLVPEPGGLALAAAGGVAAAATGCLAGRRRRRPARTRDPITSGLRDRG